MRGRNKVTYGFSDIVTKRGGMEIYNAKELVGERNAPKYYGGNARTQRDGHRVLRWETR